MKTQYSPKNNPRVIIIQKLYGKFYNAEDHLEIPKHRFKKFIKDIYIFVTGFCFSHSFPTSIKIEENIV